MRMRNPKFYRKRIGLLNNRLSWNHAAMFLIGYFFIAYPSPDTLRQTFNDEESEPAYKVFYENGFYREAIELLRVKIKEKPDTVNTDYFTYLAFCYVAGGWRDSAINVFHEILNFDSSFCLDTIYTSPKILEIFDIADSLWHVQNSEKTIISNSDTLPDSAVVNEKIPESNELILESIKQVENPQPKSKNWDRYIFYCLPGGTGQFYCKRPLNGAILLAIQAAGLVSGYWANSKRSSYFDPVYGWTDHNKRPYQKYSTYSMGGVYIFLSAYSFSVIDCFAKDRKRH